MKYSFFRRLLLQALPLLMACSLGTPGLAQAPATAEVPEAMTEYLGREIAQTMHWSGSGWLIRHKREREEASTLMREKLELKPGMVVCDLGCGNGYHTFPMAESVSPGGKVYGVEIQEPYLKMLEESAKKQGVENFVPVLGLLHDPKLPENTFDLILLVDVYHEFSHPVPMLAAMKKALKPGGAIVLVEFRAEDNDVPIKPEHKMSKEQINKELSANGYKLVKEFDGLPWQHMMWFGKAEAAPSAAKS
ncbi:MAG: class I SAM-dependent methyltransferase [Verrucomicrobium sp.]